MKMKACIQIYDIIIISQFCGEKQLGNQIKSFSDLVCSLSRTQMGAVIYPSPWERICSCSNCTHTWVLKTPNVCKYQTDGVSMQSPKNWQLGSADSYLSTKGLFLRTLLLEECVIYAQASSLC